MTNSRREFIKMVAGIIGFGATEISKPAEKPTGPIGFDAQNLALIKAQEKIDANNFGFSIPDNATIDGIKVEIIYVKRR